MVKKLPENNIDNINVRIINLIKNLGDNLLH